MNTELRCTQFTTRDKAANAPETGARAFSEQLRCTQFTTRDRAANAPETGARAFSEQTHADASSDEETQSYDVPSSPQEIKPPTPPRRGLEHFRNRTQRERRLTAQSSSLWLILILLIAFFFRVHDLGHTPLGAHYDEAANAILAAEIAEGARPLFIRAYTGKEVGYFYLAAALIRLIGQPLIAVRLTSAFIGVASVAITYRALREMFAHGMFANQESERARWVAVLAAAIQAMNLWAITVSRLGFRAGLQPPLQALTILYLYRALHGRGRRAWLSWVWAGVWCGLSAYSYLAIRAFPILLALFFLWIVAFIPAQGSAEERRPALKGRLRRLAQIAVFGLAAAVVFSPLGAFYLRNPEFFATRMGQVSVFAPEIGGSDPWGAFWHAVQVSFGMFTMRGDLNWRFNVAGAPALWPPLGLFFFVGLAIGLWRLIRPDGSLRQGPQGGLLKGTYWLLLLWLPVMLAPSILGGGDVEVSLSLRAIGVMPAMFYWPALGLAESALAARRWLTQRVSPAAGRAVAIGALILILGASGAYVYWQGFYVWGPSVPGYYVSSGYLVEAADLLNAQLPDEARVYVSAEHYRHPTMALLTERYADLKWLVGPEVLVFPTGPDAKEQETWYVFTHEAMPPQETLEHAFANGDTYAPDEYLAPDGQTAFLVYRFPPGAPPAGGVPVPQPQQPGQGNLGNTLAYLGYDLNAPALAGDTLDVTLYWQVQRPVDRDDWTFFAHLIDDRGFRWGGETFFHYPSSQWAPGEVILFHKRIGIAPGAPPGPYTLQAGVFSPSLDARLPALNADGQLSGTTVKVGPIDVARAPAPPDELPPIQQPLEARFGEALTLLGSDRDRSDLRPGETLALSLYWLLEAEVEQPAAVALWLEGPRGGAPLWQGDPVQGQYPLTRWQAPEFVRDRYALRIPLDVQAGAYDLRLALLDENGETTQVVTTNDDAARSNDGAPVRSNDSAPVRSNDFSRSLSLGTIHVHASDRLWEPPPFEHTVSAQLGDSVELRGYDLDLPGTDLSGGGQTAQPGETIHLTLVWRCLREMEVSYTVFTHLLDEGGQIRGQRDNPPQGGRYPTTLWVPGEVVVDEYALVIQPDASPGTYVIEVGMYDPATMQRLPVLDPTGAVGDRVLLGNVEIGE